MSEKQSDPSTNEQMRVSLADVLALPDEVQAIITWLIRQGEAELSEVAALIKQDEAATRNLLTDLILQGFVQEVSSECEGQPRYRTRLAGRRVRKLTLDL